MNNPKHLQPTHSDQTVILIADDEVMVHNFVRIALEAEGYFILTAADGEEALSLSRRFPGTIHALLSDVRMPKMDGLELRKRILVERPAIQVLMMSAYLDCRCGDVPFIAKPFSAAVLNARLRRLLESTAPSGA